MENFPAVFPGRGDFPAVFPGWRTFRQFFRAGGLSGSLSGLILMLSALSLFFDRK
jgi:hypothetical protein